MMIQDNTSMASDEKFPYGYDVDVYLAMAVDRIKGKYYYHWADLSQFSDQYRYAIEKTADQYHFIRYTKFSENDIAREVLDVNPSNPWNLVQTGDDFVERIASDNEWNVFRANPKVDNYRVPFTPWLDSGGWTLERYEFNRHMSGDYSAFVQAGDRMSGGSRDFFIPPSFLQGTYEEFLDQYEALVPGKKFGLYKEDFAYDEGLKRFLGFLE